MPPPSALFMVDAFPFQWFKPVWHWHRKKIEKLEDLAVEVDLFIEYKTSQ
jgi:hypothetical protein